MISTVFVSALIPNGNKRRIRLPGTDLWIMDRIDNAFVYPKMLCIERFRKAVEKTLSIWSLVAGRFLVVDQDQYIIEMSDNPIPITMVENHDLEQWSLGSYVVIDLRSNSLKSFIDEIPIHKLLQGSTEEPLVRLKLTYLVKSGECILGISWAHVLGDASSCLRFLSTISRFYQDESLLDPLPVFERRLWNQNRADISWIGRMKSLRDHEPAEQMFQSILNEQMNYEQINLQFSAEQLKILKILATNTNGNNITTQDALTAYIIRTLNIHCFQNDPENIILRADVAMNYRGVADSIAPTALVANAVFMLLSENFENPYSLISIAQSIRDSIIKARNPEFLEVFLATADALMKVMARECHMANVRAYRNEIVINSNLRYDWASLVDFGFIDQCRFHTVWTGPFYLRVFRPNPTNTQNKYRHSFKNGAEVAFRLTARMKEKFIAAWEQDIKNNFADVKD